MEDLKRFVTSSHLGLFPLRYQQIAELIGFEAMLKVAEHYAGQSIYLPKLNKLFYGIRNERIIAEFTGENQRMLAVKFSVTERRVYQVLKSHRESAQE